MVSKNTNIKAKITGIPVLALVTIVLMVLKLTGVVSWSWWAVTAPIWVPLAIAIIVILVVLIPPLITTLCKKK
jgi:hypothetical protein